MSEYQEFTGKSVEEAIKAACEAFEVGLSDLDFEILTPGSRGVLGMGAEPARIVAAPRSALGGSAPKREAAESAPLPAPRPREPREPRDDDRDRSRGRGRDRAAHSSAGGPSGGDRPATDDDARPARRAPSGDRPRSDRGRGGHRGEGQGTRGGSELTAVEVEQVTSARGSLAMERADLEAAEATPEALAAGKEILETLMGHLGFEHATVEIREGETSRLNVVGEGGDREGLGSLIGRKGERLSALQHLVNLMLSRRTGQWTRVLVDVEDYRGRRERQLADIANRAADRVVESGKMLQLEPMPALERRWIHLALRDRDGVATQSIGEEPNRRVVVLPKG
jgi:spoIIIJ-associated protein